MVVRLCPYYGADGRVRMRGDAGSAPSAVGTARKYAVQTVHQLDDLVVEPLRLVICSSTRCADVRDAAGAFRGMPEGTGEPSPGSRADT